MPYTRYELQCICAFKPCLFLFFVAGMITKQTVLKHDFTTMNRNFMGTNQTFSTRFLLQSPVFVHCQRFLVDESGSKQTHKYSRTDKGADAHSELDESTSGNIRCVLVIIPPKIYAHACLFALLMGPESKAKMGAPGSLYPHTRISSKIQY